MKISSFVKISVFFLCFLTFIHSVSAAVPRSFFYRGWLNNLGAAKDYSTPEGYCADYAAMRAGDPLDDYNFINHKVIEVGDTAECWGWVRSKRGSDIYNQYTYVGMSIIRFCPENSKSNIYGTCDCNYGSIELNNRCEAASVDMGRMCRISGYRTPYPVILPIAQKYMNEVDYFDAGVNPLSIERTYLHRRRQNESLMGAGWSHSYAVRLEHVKNSQGISKKAQINFGDGSYLWFDWVNGAWVARNGSSSLTQVGHGWILNDLQNGDIRNFDESGKLLRHERRNGWFIEYEYDAGDRIAEVRNGFGRRLNFVYGSQGKLQDIDVDGVREVGFEYDAMGNLQKVIYKDGSTIGYKYEDLRYPHFLTGVTDENNNRLSTFKYNADGQVIDTERANGVAKYQIGYPSQDYGETQVIDPLGRQRFYRYKNAFGVLEVTSSSAPGVSGELDAASRIQGSSGLRESETDFKGAKKTFGWDHGRRLLTSVTEAVGTPQERTANMEWHPQWSLPSRIVESGRQASYTYDAKGRLLSLAVGDVGAADNSAPGWQWSYAASGLVASETAPNGATSSFAYDGFGNLSSTKNALGHLDHFIHGAGGRLQSHTATTGLASSFEYDLRGRLIRLQRDGEVSLYRYLPSGQMQGLTASNGHQVSYIYDNAQRLIGWNDNRGNSASYILDNMGNRLDEIVRDAGNQPAWVVKRTINSLNRIQRLTIGEVATEFGYDANGDLISSVRPANGSSRGTSIGLDPLRRVGAITNEDNASASLSYNALDAVTSAQDFKGVTTTYTRDALGNAKAEATPDAGNITATYDALGLIATAKDAAGRTLAVQRDALGRPTQLQYGSTATSTLRYDLPGTTYNGPGAPKASTGHLSEIQDPGVTTQYQRDILGRVLRKSQILANGDTKSLIHSYVPAGQGGGGELQSITYPSGRQATYLYDSTGQITGLQWNGQPLVTGLTWSPLGQPTAWQWTGFAQQPGATATLAEQRSYNPAGQLASSKLLNLTWDAAGRISLIQQQHMLPGTAAAQQAKLSSAFSYDAVGRLTASAHSAPAGLTLPTGWSLADTIELSASGYAWDGNGNRTEVHYTNALASGTSTLKRNYQTAAGTNRLQSYAQTLQRPGSAAQNSNVTFSYDAAGALVKKGDNHLHYGADGRIAKAGEYADAADARAVSYVYNALGQRVLKSDARGAGQPATLQTLYAEDGIGSTVLGQYANQRSANSAAPAGQSDSTEIIYLPTASGPMPIAAEINGRLYAIHTDHLNTPRRLTNQQGQVAWQWLISGFGEVRPTTGDRGYGQTVSGPSYAQAVKFDLRYPGQVFDEETGLSYNLHRYYDAATGRYIQADPIGLEGGWNRFGYVSGNPLNRTDSRGLLEDFVFDVRQGSLTSDCSCMSGSIDAFSGQGPRKNNPEMEYIVGGGPIPRGRYFIVDPYIYTNDPTDKLGGLTFFKLMPDNGQYGDGLNVLMPTDNGSTVYRDRFRFHPGTISNGCVTTSNVEAWKKIQFQLLNKTKIELLPNGQPYLGSITVR